MFDQWVNEEVICSNGCTFNAYDAIYTMLHKGTKDMPEEGEYTCPQCGVELTGEEQDKTIKL